MRKSPVKHKVSSFTRNGKPVNAYLRGQGTKSVKKLAKPIVGKLPKGYTVIFTFSKKKGDKETVKVIATSYMKALDEAFEEKLDERMPVEIVIIDPSIGEILHWAGKRALEFGKTATKKIAKGAYESAKKAALSGIDDWKVKRLIEDAYSSNFSKKMLAKAKLKRDYPHVWDIMDISPS